MTDYEIFQLDNLVLQSGVTLNPVRIAYQTYGKLNGARDNAILMPTFFGGQHMDTELMMARGRALDPDRFFIIVPNMLGNGLSSSPSNTPPPFDRATFPNISLYDNVRCQHLLVTEHLDIDHLRLVVGFSMGAQMAFQWGSLYSEMVDAIAPICGSARTSAHNYLLLDAARIALLTDDAFDDGWFAHPPIKGLLAFCRVYCSLVFAPGFFREREYQKLGLTSPVDTMRFFEGFFRQRDANDLMASLWTWQNADISANDVYKGDFPAALRAIKARTVVMPSQGDLLFHVGDSEFEVQHMPNAELRIIRSNWGHVAGYGANPPDNQFIDTALNELLVRDEIRAVGSLTS
jgi:homoserine O-acetyltransferase/O-succinyltransferase